MTIATAVVQIIASILSYLSVRELDKFISRWIAYFMIAWEKVASQSAMEEYNKTKQDLISAMPEKWKQWEDWRNSLSQPPK